MPKKPAAVDAETFQITMRANGQECVLVECTDCRCFVQKKYITVEGEHARCPRCQQEEQEFRTRADA